MKLWQKNYTTDEFMQQFTVGKDRETDMLLAEFDVLGSLAHIQMLESVQLLDSQELVVLQAALKQIYADIKENRFSIADGIEDVHSQVELLLTKQLGNVGKKIHSGRSRNDQVLLDIKLYIRHQIKEILNSIAILFETLQNLSEKHKNDLLVGYTHFQIAMPSSFGLFFGAYAESLTDDLLVLQAAYRVANQNPLGSAAGFGSSLPINRRQTTDLLGFEDLNYNVVYAQMTRGKTEKITAFALSSVAATLARLSADICLYMSQNMDFLTLPKELTTGSSIMPHKKNPDVFELIRAKCNRLQALPQEINLLMTNLISGYHRDFQIIKEIFLPAFAELHACLEMAIFMLPQITVRKDILKEKKYDYVFTVEAVNKEVTQNGLSFRDAYQKVGTEVENNTFKPDYDFAHTHEGSIGNLCNEDIKNKFDKIIFEFDLKKSDKMYDLLK